MLYNFYIYDLDSCTFKMLILVIIFSTLIHFGLYTYKMFSMFFVLLISVLILLKIDYFGYFIFISNQNNPSLKIQRLK